MNDFLRDAGGDLAILNGDFAFAKATTQHQIDIIEAWKGWWHFAPTVGVGARRWLLDEATGVGLTRSIHSELERDGQVVESVRLSAEAVQVVADYA